MIHVCPWPLLIYMICHLPLLFDICPSFMFRFKGLRDDLTCLLEEDLTSISLCALHCEMRNTEQLLRSLGLLAHEIGSLTECNGALKKYGPENFKGHRITVKLKPGQQTAANRNNISVSSFSG